MLKKRGLQGFLLCHLHFITFEMKACKKSHSFPHILTLPNSWFMKVFVFKTD